MSSVKASYLAPAKLNLFLHITARRADGYHCLQTLFQFLDYCDTLHFTVRSDGQLTCRSTAQDLPSEQDIVLKTAYLLKQHSHTALGIDIQVEKKIPIGGGLGGGSSDAATTLIALNKLWQLHLSTSTLMQLGLTLGADVPVFVQGRAAWAEGVGEILTPVELIEPIYLIIHPNCSVSTAQIFNDPTLIRNLPPITFDDFLAGHTTNICEVVVFRRYPQIKAAFEWLNQFQSARLTGTGACLFARFDSSEQAQKILAQLPTQWTGFVAQGRNKSPLCNVTAR